MLQINEDGKQPKEGYSTPITTAKGKSNSEVHEKDGQAGEDKVSGSEQENAEADIPGTMVITSQSDAIAELHRQKE